MALDTLAAVENDKIYEPVYHLYTHPENHKVQPTFVDMHHIATMKQNGSFWTTVRMFNVVIRAPVGLPPERCTLIYNAVQRSDHVLCCQYWKSTPSIKPQ